MSKNSNSDIESEVGKVMGNSPLGKVLTVVITIIILVVGAVVGGKTFLSTDSSGANNLGVISTPAGNSSSGRSSCTSSNALPAQSFKQTAKSINFNGCPRQGDGGYRVCSNSK